MSHSPPCSLLNAATAATDQQKGFKASPLASRAQWVSANPPAAQPGCQIMAGKGLSVPVSSSLLAALVRITSHMREVKQLEGENDLNPFLKVLLVIVKVGCPFGHTYEI